jgi:hypothetical protein
MNSENLKNFMFSLKVSIYDPSFNQDMMKM